jgi:hypothetical protein
MKSSYEAALARVVAVESKDKNRVPKITDPMGKHWEQPDAAGFAIDDSFAMMTQSDFDKLHDYSHSQPTEVYPGKMWRAQYGKPGEKKWFLCWFGISDRPGFVSNNYREILIA